MTQVALDTGNTDTPVPLEDDLALLLEAATEGGRIAMRYFHGHDDNVVAYKSGNSPVSTADHAVDRYLRETLTGARPAYGWLSEETEELDAEGRMAAARTFVVDPIDGTRAFLDGRETWCVSAAIVENGVSVAGVLSCPALHETIHAVAGGGAWKNGVRLKIEGSARLPVIAASQTVIRHIESVFPQGITRYPHVPSLAYRLAMVADGRLDATVVKPKAHDWDIAAAELILRESGGELCETDGGPVHLNGASPGKPAMLAGNAKTLRPMFGVVTADAFG